MLTLAKNFWCVRNLAKLYHTLSYNDAVSALKPFYFIVHPDRFGKYPTAQKINENSLKKLNEYLLAVSKQQLMGEVTVPFYIRNVQRNSDGMQRPSDNFTVVSISLSTNSLDNVVSNVLQTCNLPLPDVPTLKSKLGKVGGKNKLDPNKNRPIRWHASFYEAYGIPNPEEKPASIRTKSLSKWLERNVAKAHKLQAAHEALSQETERLKEQVKQATGLKQIKWASSWGFKQFRTSLLSLQRLHKTFASELQLEGQSLMFGNENGVCLRGNIFVKNDEIAETWLPLLKNISTHHAILETLPALECQLSVLLNNAKIIRRVGSPVILACDYQKQLHKLIQLLSSYMAAAHDKSKVAQSLHDVEVVVECAEGPLCINDQGQILIPSSYSPFMVIDFLNDNADRSRHIKKDNILALENTARIVKNCCNTLHLRSLKKDSNVTAEEMRICCKDLIDHSDTLLCYVPYCRLKICRFYSVMSDGEICIPWDWATQI